MAAPVPETRPRVAVAIPCYNEAAAVADVIRGWREALPDAEVLVFDNNSTDGTGRLAREAGVTVVDVPEQGKGYAVRAIFGRLREYDAVILVDGDGTYPADHVGPLLGPILKGEADMTVGIRRPVAGAGAGAGASAMAPVRSVGNVLINAAFRVLIGPGNRDLLSGYRVFGPTYLHAVTPRSAGFEVETELASEAVARGLRVVEAEVPYYPRYAGTVSKLRAFRDGRIILGMIVTQGVRLRPWRLGAVAAVVIAAVAGVIRLTMGASSR